MTKELRTIDDAWLGLDIDDTDIFNPTSILKVSDEDYHLRLSYLMMRPEYFSFLCKHILNVQILPSQDAPRKRKNTIELQPFCTSCLPKAP